MRSIHVKPIVALLAVAVLFGYTATLSAKDEELKPQTDCPVMGKKIKDSKFVDHEDHRYFFCCSTCMRKFKKSPAKYIKRMEKAGIAPAKTPVEDDEKDSEAKDSEPKREGS